MLQQRAAFLRPNSLLAIVMLTDENDCSIVDENNQQGWLTGRRIPMPRGSDACARPDDPNIYRCCLPCVLLDVPDALPPDCNYAGDVSCNAGHSLTPIEDSTNLRCFDQVRRFGVNLLYPWERYVDALTSPRIVGSSGIEAQNPLFKPGDDGTPARDPSLVFLVGIVGVPWQDLANESSLTGPGLTYLTAEELAVRGRWDVMLGDPELGVPPTDPFMVESIEPRTGRNPIIGDAPGSNNAINGHEQNIVNQDDLQYACTFPLVPQVPCTMSNQTGCDCNGSEQEYDRSTCEYPELNGLDGIQIAAKAYPGIRQLQVLKGLGNAAVVASICPKNVEPRGGDALADPDYGYNPAVGAMMGRFREALGARCLPRAFEVDGDGRLACTVVEVTPPSASGCSCTSPGRANLASRGTTREALEDELAFSGYCDGATGIACSDYCSCEIEQFAGAELLGCQFEPSDPGTQFGFCYVDPDGGLGSPELVSGCAPTQRRLLRFMGDDLPAPNAQAFVVCTDE